MWHLWDGRGDLATWVTTLAVGFAGWELRTGARRRVREQASQVEVYAVENRVLGRVTVNGVVVTHPSHEVRLMNGSSRPIYFPHAIFGEVSRFRRPSWRRKVVSRSSLKPYDFREGLVGPGQEADLLCSIDAGCYVVFRDSDNRDWARDVLSQKLWRVWRWTGVVRFDKRLMPIQVFVDPLQVEEQWKAKHNQDKAT